MPNLNTRASILGLAGGLLLLGAALVVVAALDIFPFGRGSSEFADAVANAPAGTERVSWTDWSGVRGQLGSEVDSRSSAAELSAFLEDGYDADLTSRSALLQSAPVLQSSFGFSPASVEWELFSQSQEGAVITLRVADDTDFAALGDRLEDLGYRRPTSDNGVWEGGPDLVSAIGVDLTPELAYLALDEDHHLVLASDQRAFLETAVRSASGGGDRVDGLGEVVDAVGEPLSAAVYSGAYACGALAMGQADDEDQAQADELVAAAGTIDPYRAFAMALRPDGDVRVAMEFENDDQARANADSRAALASGPAVGQGGEFAERFALRSASADGTMVVLDLDPVDGAYVLGDLSSGPVLFATC